MMLNLVNAEAKSSRTDSSSEKINIKILSKTSVIVSMIAIQLKPGIHSHIQRNIFQKVHCLKMRELHLHLSELIEKGIQLKYCPLFLIIYYIENREMFVVRLLENSHVNKHDYFFA